MRCFLLLPLLAGTAAAGPQEDDIWERLSFYGNGRLRWESTFNQPGAEDRHRGRMRARVGAEYRIMDDLRVELRLSSTSDGNDANNPHWDFGDGSDGFNGIDAVLDRYYLDWQPIENLAVKGGKMPHAFKKPPVVSEFVWDDDVQPSGFAAVYGGESGDLTWDLRGAAYVAAESGSADDATMYGGQANAQYEASEDLTLGLSTSFSEWSDLAGFAGTFGNQGNTGFAMDFGVWDTFLSASSGDWRGFGQYINNTATGSEDQGYAFGAQYGTGGSPGDTNVFAAYYDLDADSIFSPVAQDDTPIPGTGAGTGMEGVVAGVRYHVRENLSLRLWVLTSDTDQGDPVRVRFDLDFKVR